MLMIRGWMTFPSVIIPTLFHFHPCTHTHTLAGTHALRHTLSSDCQLVGVLLVDAVDDKGLPAADPDHPYKHRDRGVHSSPGPSPNIELAQC